MTTHTAPANAVPFRLLGHAINQVQDCMEAAEPGFSVLVTGDLATDDCFQTVLAGFVEGSAYDQEEVINGDSTVTLRFRRK